MTPKEEQKHMDLLPDERVVRVIDDMDPENYLEILREDDGDLILTITAKGLAGDFRSAGIQLCTHQGGGKHHELWMALARYFKKQKGEEMLADTRKADCHEELVAIINYAKEILLINSAYQFTKGRKYEGESLAECAAKVDKSLTDCLARATNHQEG